MYRLPGKSRTSGKKVPDRRYTDEFKVEAIRLAESIGNNQAATRLGIPASSLGNWMKLKRVGKLRALNAVATRPRGPVSELEAENTRLRRELASAKLDLEIVKKAAVSSMGERNTCLKFKCGSTETQRFSRALVQA